MELNPIVIGIAGGTGSGKSTLASNIKKEFENNISMLSHDYYYKSNENLSFEELMYWADVKKKVCNMLSVAWEEETKHRYDAIPSRWWTNF